MEWGGEVGGRTQERLGPILLHASHIEYLSAPTRNSRPRRASIVVHGSKHLTATASIDSLLLFVASRLAVGWCSAERTAQRDTGVRTMIHQSKDLTVVSSRAKYPGRWSGAPEGDVREGVVVEGVVRQVRNHTVEVGVALHRSAPA